MVISNKRATTTKCIFKKNTHNTTKQNSVSKRCVPFEHGWCLYKSRSEWISALARLCLCSLWKYSHASNEINIYYHRRVLLQFPERGLSLPVLFLAHDSLSENKTTLFTPISVTGTMGESIGSNFFVLIRVTSRSWLLLSPPLWSRLSEKELRTLCSISAPHAHWSPPLLCAARNRPPGKI